MLWVKHQFVCVCVSGVSSDNCTELVFVPQSHAAGTKSEERKQGHISLPYLFIPPPVISISAGAFISLSPAKKKTIILQSSKEPPSLFLSQFVQRPPAPHQYFVSFSTWFSEDRQEGDNMLWR